MTTSDDQNNSSVPPSNWACPHACPYQSDDGLQSLISRVSLPLLTALAIGVFWVPVVHQEKRPLNKQEFTIGLVALFLSYQPTLFSELANKFVGIQAARKNN